MRLVLLVVVDTDKQKSPLIVRKGIEVFLFTNLLQRTLSAAIALQFDNQGWVASLAWNKNDIREALARSHLPDDGIAVQGMYISKTNGTLQSVLVVVTKIAGYMDMRNI